MSTILTQKHNVLADQQKQTIAWREKFYLLLNYWEVALILAIAALLRLFAIDKVIFDDDEAIVFHMAHDIVAHGLLPLTSNRASIGNLNPPLVIYFFMVPASFSPDPVWGQVMVALFNIAAVLLTYFFTRRYYGRAAGTIAGLLYATAVGTWLYSRNIWPQNFVPFFVLLFMFVLYRGVVEKKRNWLFPAVVFLGILYQFHGSTLLLLAPLGCALLLAWRSIRIRDVVFSVLALIFLFSPYIIWECYSNFSDIKIILSNAQPPVINRQALNCYLFFVDPILRNPYLDPASKALDNHILLPDGHSILLTTPLHYIFRLLKAEYILEVVLLLGGILTAALIVVLPARQKSEEVSSWRSKVSKWWRELQNDPTRKGLLLLLAWQVVPVLALTRHSILLFAHYFIFLAPGEFMLIAFFLIKSAEYVQRVRPSWHHYVRYAMFCLAMLVIVAQCIGSGSEVIDIAAGNFDSQQVYPSFNDLHSLQNALSAADALAQREHIHRIYATISFTTGSAMAYLSEGVKTPIALFDTWHCMVLPDPGAGPVVFLAEPYNPMISTMLSQYASAQLVAEPPRLGGAPFQLYILRSKPEPAPVPHTFSQGLALLSPEAHLLQSTVTKQEWLSTRWKVLDTQTPATRTTYWYNFHIQTDKISVPEQTISCTPTATWTGDQIISFLELTRGHVIPSHMTITASTLINQPEILHVGAVTLTTFNNVDTHQQRLVSIDKNPAVSFSVVNGDS